MLRLTEEQKKQRRKETQHRYHLKRNGRPVPPLTPLIRPIDTSLSQAQQSRKKSQRRYYVKNIMKPGAPSATPSEREIVEARLNREAQARMTPPVERQETEATPMPVETPPGQRLGTTPLRDESRAFLVAESLKRSKEERAQVRAFRAKIVDSAFKLADEDAKEHKEGLLQEERYREMLTLGGQVEGASTGDERRGGRR